MTILIIAIVVVFLGLLVISIEMGCPYVHVMNRSDGLDRQPVKAGTLGYSELLPVSPIYRVIHDYSSQGFDYLLCEELPCLFQTLS